MLTYFIDVNTIYWGKSFFQVVFYISLVLIFIFAKRRETKISFVFYPVLFFVGIFNPLAYWIGKILFAGAWQYYTRLYSLVPILYCIAFGAVLLLQKLPKLVKLLCVGVLCAFIVFQGNYVYHEPWMRRAQNVSKVPTAVIRISEHMHEVDKGEIIKIAFPEDLSAYARQYDPTFVTPYGRIWGDPSFSAKLETADVDGVLEAAGKTDCDYVVTLDWDVVRTAWEEKGYNRIFTTNGYDVYDIRSNARTVRTLNEKRQVVAQGEVDKEGNIVLNRSGWATIRYEYNDEGRRIKELYRNPDGSPFTLSNGYAGRAWTYYVDGRARYETFLDADQKPIRLGYATVENKYENKRLAEQTYLDEKGETITRTDAFYAKRRILYNPDGRSIGERYEDLNGQLVISSSGYAGYDDTLDGKNRLKRRVYLDTQEHPMLLTSGYSMIDRRYDDAGNMLSEVYLDQNGERTTITSGYAELIRDYNPKRQMIYERYADVSGEPVLMPDGYYGIRREYNEAGLIAEEWYVDSEGNEVTRRQGYSRLAREYDENKRLARESYYVLGMPFTLADGYQSFTRDYDRNGNIIREQYFDSDGKPCTRTAGYASIKREYNVKNQLVSEEYLNKEGIPTRLSSGYSKFTRDYDILGNMVKESYFHEGKPQACTNGYDTYERIYNDRKLIIEETYLKDGKVIRRPDTMYAGYTREYDDRNNIVKEMYFDVNHAPVLRNGGYASVKREYNELRQITREEYLGENGEPVLLAQGYAGFTRTLDHCGNVLEEVYLGTDGNPIIRNTGYAKLIRTYNAKKQVLEERYEDTTGAPIANTSGYFGIDREYDAAYHQIKETYLDEDGNQVMIGSGYVAFERKADRKGNITEETYLDTEGNPVTKTSGIQISKLTREYNPRSQNIKERYDVPVGEGYVEVDREYNISGDIIKETLLDAEGKPVLRNAGYVTLSRSYDARRRLTREEYQLEDGQLRSAFERFYDDWNNVVEERYLNSEGIPHTDNYASLERTWDEHRWLLEEKYFDAEHNPVKSSSGFAILRREYDEVGNIISETYYDEDGNPINRNEGYARIERTWDERKQLLSERFFDVDGKLVGTSKVREYDGYKLLKETKYDAEGNEVE